MFEYDEISTDSTIMYTVLMRYFDWKVPMECYPVFNSRQRNLEEPFSLEKFIGLTK